MTPDLPLHHVGIVQPSEDDALEMMRMMGLREDYRGYVPQWSALCIFTVASHGSPVEFVVPDGGPLLRFNKGAGGLHHLAFETPDLDEVGRQLAAEDARFLEAEHVKGAGPFICNFVSPIYTRGITIEYVQMLKA
jgi:catechol 2,3-dioxygenase-like lactoylglutathione lyase family enzyme